MIRLGLVGAVLVLCLLGGSADLDIPLRSQVERRLKEFSRLVLENGGVGAHHWGLSEALRIKGETAEAARHAMVALYLDKRLATPQNLLATADMFRSLGNATMALQLYARTTLAGATQPSPHVYAGLCYELMADDAKAVRAFATARRLAPRESRKGESYRVYEAGAYLRSGNMQGAHNALCWVLGPPCGGGLPMSVIYLLHHFDGTEKPSRLGVIAMPQGPDETARVVSLRMERASLTPWQHDHMLGELKAQAQTLQRNLATHQNKDCNAGRMLVYTLDQAFGYGAHAHLLSFSMGLALSLNRTLVVCAPLSEGWWLTDPACQARNFECYFQPVSRCSCADLLARGGYGESVLTAHRDAPVVHFGPDAQSRLMRDPKIIRSVPDRYRLNGLLWWRSQLLHFLLQPNTHTQRLFEKGSAWQRVQAARKQPGAILVGMHVRYGDKLVEANHLPLQTYLAVIRALPIALGCDSTHMHVVVGTDSRHVSQQCELELRGTGINVIVDHDQLRGTDITNANVLNHLRLDVGRYGAEAIGVAALLSQCDIFVGTFSSNMGRLIYELMQARCLHEDPPSLPLAISLDRPWFAYP